MKTNNKEEIIILFKYLFGSIYRIVMNNSYKILGIIIIALLLIYSVDYLEGKRGVYYPTTGYCNEGVSSHKLTGYGFKMDPYWEYNLVGRRILKHVYSYVTTNEISSRYIESELLKTIRSNIENKYGVKIRDNVASKDHMVIKINVFKEDVPEKPGFSIIKKVQVITYYNYTILSSLTIYEMITLIFGSIGIISFIILILLKKTLKRNAKTKIFLLLLIIPLSIFVLSENPRGLLLPNVFYLGMIYLSLIFFIKIFDFSILKKRQDYK